MKRHKASYYPKYMYPKGTWHHIPQCAKVGRMMVLRFIYKSKMPSGGFISFDMMKSFMRDSQFYEGLSVNLLSRFKKRDAIFWVDDKHLTSYWDNKSTAPKVPLTKLLEIHNPGYFGFLISDIEKIESTFQIYKQNGKVERTDIVRCKAVHCPTKVNFWHYNIFLYGEKLVNNQPVEYLLSEELTKNKVASVASILMEDFYECLKLGSQLHSKSLPKKLYKKGLLWEKIREDYTI